MCNDLTSSCPHCAVCMSVHVSYCTSATCVCTGWLMNSDSVPNITHIRHNDCINVCSEASWHLAAAQTTALIHWQQSAFIYTLSSQYSHNSQLDWGEHVFYTNLQDLNHSIITFIQQKNMSSNREPVQYLVDTVLPCVFVIIRIIPCDDSVVNIDIQCPELSNNPITRCEAKTSGNDQECFIIPTQSRIV